MLDLSNLEGKLLLAMPEMGDPRFDRAVVYVCTHNNEGAMGIVINHPVQDLDFPDLMKQLNITAADGKKPPEIQIHAGGPVETGRGFVLHSADYVQDTSIIISQTVALTATVDILRAMARGEGPTNQLLALGYAGWSAGQLESEVEQNAWLCADADDEIIFKTQLSDKWPLAMRMLGVDITMLSGSAGHA